jgi:hypothetical protein
MADTRADALHFFVAKVVSEAERQGLALSDAERKMLRWSEVEPGCVSGPMATAELAGEVSDDEYEAKISRLLEGAYERDIASDDGTRDAYKRAYSVLKAGDYYLLVMIDRALGRRLRPWWHFSVSCHSGGTPGGAGGAATWAWGGGHWGRGGWPCGTPSNERMKQTSLSATPG